MRRPILILGGIATALMAAGSWGQTTVDKSFTTVSKDCSGVQWSDAALNKYPTIGSACQGVETREGKTYVKFEGKVDKNINKGEQLAVNFKDGGVITLSPPANTALYVNGKKTPVAQLQRGDALNFYVPEDRLVAQFPEENPTQYVVVPIVYREVIREPATEQAASLPHTAGDLPLVALSGFMLLGLGAGLTLFRRKS